MTTPQETDFKEVVKDKIKGLADDKIDLLAGQVSVSCGYSKSTVRRWFNADSAPHPSVHQALFAAIDTAKRALKIS